MRKRATRNLPAIVLAGLILALTLRSAPIASATAPLLFFTTNITATSSSPDPTEMEEALLELIDNATTSIDVAIYDFNRDSIRDALLTAQANGIAVRVATDDEVRHETASYVPYYKELEEAGIPVVDDQRPGSIMHNKFFIVDGRYVWTGD
jgi:phosphatidylserine/phosphatidylglycerophosphate/cardiolipin synthase-like enzyme